MMENMEYGRQRLKSIVKERSRRRSQGATARRRHDLTPHEHERALKGAYRSFVVPGIQKVDIDSYFDQTKPHIKTLIEDELKEIRSARIIMTLWVRWKKPVKLAITLDPEDVEGIQDVNGSTGDNYARVEMPFNNLMTEFLRVAILQS